MPIRQIGRHLNGARLTASVAVLLCATVSVAQAQEPSLTPELQAVRDGLDQYRDPIRAIYDGYLSTVGCIAYPEGGTEGTMSYPAGGMGVHFLNMSFVGPELDPTKPQVLIYVPDGDELRLVAAEWFMPAELAGDNRPTIFGHELQGPMEGHKPLMPAGMHHLDLHVWLWEENPAGVFSPTNPAVSCPAAAYSFNESAPNMVEHGH
jgi:hypothetical protein